MAVKPPRPRMPPLNALRAFEAAARTGGFAQAAGELNVTPAAVAQQVKALEAWLGCALFDRMAQGVRLSDRGTAALPRLTLAFDALGEAVRELNGVAQPGQLAVAALPSIASLWLAPLLAEMRVAFPGVSVSITAMESRPNLTREPYDLGLFYLPLADAGAGETTLCVDRVAPVCSPDLAPGDGEAPAAWLSRQTLLHDSSWAGDWRLWLDRAGVEGVATAAGPRFSLYSLAVQAAIEGAGVLVGHDALVAPALRRGALISPFPTWTPTGRRLTALTPARASPLVQRLTDWLARASRNAGISAGASLATGATSFSE